MTTQRDPRATESDIEDLQSQYLEQLEVLGEAAKRVQEALESAAGAFSIVRNHVRHGGFISDFLGVIQPDALRASLTTSLDDLERARHRSQQLMFRLLQAEGKSMSEIARAWGISRQLVSRLINEDL
jgi:hypothetical protein